MTEQTIKELYDWMEQHRVKRDGFIMLPTMTGYEIIPFDGDKLRNIARL